MIAFGCATSDEREFRAHAAGSIEAVSESDSLLMRRHRYVTIDRPYNEMLAEVGGRDDLEALVLLHQGVEIADQRFLPRVRGLLAAGPDIGLIGVAADSGGAREVEEVAGDLLVLSGWACAELRFDPVLADSLDALVRDLCLGTRAAGRRVVADSFDAFCVAPEGDADRPRRLAAGASLRRKWDLGVPA